MNSTLKKGFTLVELLIVIGILAVLATTAVVILNPAQLLAQARDSQRLSDLASLQSALALYVTDTTTPDMDGPLATCGTAGTFGYSQQTVTGTGSFTAAPNT